MDVNNMTLEDRLLLMIYMIEEKSGIRGESFSVKDVFGGDIEDMICRDIAAKADEDGYVHLCSEISQVPKVSITDCGRCHIERLIAEAEKQ